MRTRLNEITRDRNKRVYRQAVAGNWKCLARASEARVRSGLGHLIQCFTGLLIAVEYTGPPRFTTVNLSTPVCPSSRVRGDGRSLSFPGAPIPYPPYPPCPPPVPHKSLPLVFVSSRLALAALILRQINASLSSRRFTNQADALVRDDRSRAEARTILNSNENRPLNLPLSLFSASRARVHRSRVSAYSS